MTIAIPTEGAYLGSYVDFGDTEDHVTIEGIDKYETMIGKHLAIVASSSYWGEQTFPLENLERVTRHGSIPLIYWSPWDKPYDQDKGPDRFSLKAILEGKWDAYIDRWSEGAKAFGKPFFVSFCNEMNGEWFPWSGWFYGQEKGGPETFKKAWRYVVDRTRARGAKNIVWVFQVNNYSAPEDDWNLCGQYYPGPDYVDWLGLSVYGMQFRDKNSSWAEFRDLLDYPYKEIAALDPKKPIMLAEFGVGEFPDNGDKAQWFRDAFAQMPKYPRLKAAVYWHERWQNEDESYSNLRVNSSPQALQAFRAGVANSFWLSAPVYQPAKSNESQTVILDRRDIIQ